MGSSKKGEEKEGRRRRRDDSSDEEKERSSRRDRERRRERSRDRERDRSRERGRHKEKTKRGRSKERERSRSRERNQRSRSREKRSRSRDKERDRSQSREREKSERSKEKERDREAGHHSKHSPSPERSDDTHGRKHKTSSSRKSESSHKRSSRKRSRSPSSSDREEEHTKSSKKQKSESPKLQKREESPSSEPENEGPILKGSGKAMSLSVEETNKLRAKLGLKPLEVGDDSSKKEEGEGEANEEESSSSSVKKDVHVPARNIGDIKMAKKLKEKMETMREKRRIAKKLASVRTLGEAEDEEENTATWVKRMKQLADEKAQAEKRAKLLEEMEEEFGVGDLVSETFREEKRHAYSSRDLKGLKVEHKMEAFREGRGVILTLKDTAVLDEGDDVLVNVNITGEEKAAKNVELKKGKPRYNPYEDEEEEEEGRLPSLLKKYDEEIEGVKKESFELGESGAVDTEEQRKRELVRQQLKARGISLETVPSQLATEYFTTEEMVQFKKPRRKKKVRKREKLKADDLLPLPEEVRARDHGSRDHGSRRRAGAEMEEDIPGVIDEAMGVIDDEMEGELDAALMKTRRLLNRTKSEVSGAAKVANMLQSIPKADQESESLGEMIVLNATAEFCRQVGGEEEEQTRGRMPSRAEEEEEMEMEEMAAAMESSGGWMEVQPVAGERPPTPKEDELYQEQEPIVASGITAALQMATRKGFFEAGKSKRGPGESLLVSTNAQRDREYERQKERERERDLSRYRDMAFPEKKGYTPNVKIEYVDDSGRLLNRKEAFRFMSHKFHGRGSGKRKMERRMKKIQDEEFMKKSSSIDTPLNTLAMLQAKQHQSQTPYLVLSGGAHAMLAPGDISKRK